ncbi:hypothetical protein PF008_g27270 [Phytophthora fragariae]|uniref:DUF6818 domain-containing protein n=3 Tax=Phytophthora fragariae TaxID=53985 RepID=A0A6G0QEN7_9STRA|nr:hypothetical protein PF008_g27270 [Phytophthora fragariae]
MPEISRLLAVVEELLPLGRDEWERVTIAYNSNRSRSWAERDLDSLRRKFKALYSARKPTGTADMPPHIKKAKLTKLAIDEKANVVEMDDAADQDPDEDSATGDQRLFVEPGYCFEPYYDDQEGNGDGDFAGSDAASTNQSGSDDFQPDDVTGAAVADAVLSAQASLPVEAPGTFDLQLGAEGLDAFASTLKAATRPAGPSTRHLRSAGSKKPMNTTATRSCTAEVAATMATKTPAARGFQPVGRDEQEAYRHISLQSASSRLGGGNLYAFRESVGSKRTREDLNQEQAEASFAKAKRLRATKASAALKQKLADLENCSNTLGTSTFEMMMMFREEHERKLENRRVEEDQRRREEAAAKEARLLADKAEDEERRRQDKLEMDDRARRDKEEARARTQEMLLLIEAMFKKE